MTRSWRLAAIAILVAGGMLAPATASAHDPEEDHGAAGYQGPDNSSQNMKLLANLAKAEGTTTQSDLAFDGKLAFAGNYQGFRVIDVSDPTAPETISDFRCNGAQSDVSVYSGGTTAVDVDKLLAGASEADAEVGYAQLHGADTWSSYWYNGHIYANDVTRGLDIFLLSDKARSGAKKLPYLNPQTQESVIN